MVDFLSLSRGGLLWALVLVVILAVLDRTIGSLVGYVPGQDYPAYDQIPSGLTFTCSGKQPGYYADPETQCQVWHWCVPGGRRHSFLCPNGTVFNQAVRVCDWFFNVDCQKAPDQYSVNDDLYKDAEGNLIAG